MRWIKVEDKFPKEYEEVIVCAKFGNEFKVYCCETYISSWYENKKVDPKLLDSNCYPMADITHWMPLPEPPKD